MFNPDFVVEIVVMALKCNKDKDYQVIFWLTE
jgi:hypothetical protein